MKEFYFIYKDKVEDRSFKYINIIADDISNAIPLFKEQLPNAIFYVVYDKSIYPYFKKI